MTFLVVANFKSNFTKVQVTSWLKQVSPQQDMIIAPSFPHLSLFQDQISQFKLASQDVSSFPKGAYTGAVNAEQLKELGISYAIVGHSERRRYFHENPTDIANKIMELLAIGITPLVCMDEADVLPQFRAIDTAYLDRCIYCYEPGDGLGGSQVASKDQINKVHDLINKFAPSAQIIYGGSVTQNNVLELLDLNLSGVLVATASLNPASYLKIYEVSHGS